MFEIAKKKKLQQNMSEQASKIFFYIFIISFLGIWDFCSLTNCFLGWTDKNSAKSVRIKSSFKLTNSHEEKRENFVHNYFSKFKTFNV